MTIYEINEAIFDLVDVETGEIKDAEAFEALQMEREEKIENMAIWIKQLLSDANAIKVEIDRLKERKEKAERKAEHLKALLASVLNGDKFSTAKCSVGFRKSKAVKVDDDFIEWAKKNADDLLLYKEPTASLSAIKEAIAQGWSIPHASVEEKTSIIIK